MALSDLVTKLSTFINKYYQIALAPLSATMMYCSAKNRGGMSPIMITAKILTDLAQKGIHVSTNIDGSDNLMNKMIYSIVSNVVESIHLDSKVSVAAMPGEITMTGTAIGPTGPIPVTVVNNNPIVLTGIQQ